MSVAFVDFGAQIISLLSCEYNFLLEAWRIWKKTSTAHDWAFGIIPDVLSNWRKNSTTRSPDPFGIAQQGIAECTSLSSLRFWSQQSSPASRAFDRTHFRWLCGSHVLHLPESLHNTSRSPGKYFRAFLEQAFPWVSIINALFLFKESHAPATWTRCETVRLQ